MKIATYREAVDYLESFIGKVVFKVDKEYLKYHDPLERMRVLLSLLGNPQNKFKSVLIGGTSGKGSTAYLISNLLTTAGYKTGLTISPHLQKVNERLQINGKSISDEEFTKMVGLMVQIIELIKIKPVGAPSYFEIIVAMAFLYFAKEHVDIAVVEVGMGGEFDATNTLYPLVAVLTNVTLDHTNILGETVQKIARTKSGIIKFARGPVAPSSHPMSSVSASGGSLRALDGTSTPVKQANSTFGLRSSSRATPRLLVITGVKQPSVIKIVEERCKDAGAKLLRFGKDFSYTIKKESLEGSVFDLTIACDRMKQLNDLELSLLGKHQIENASLAILTILQLKKFGFKVSNQQIRTALKTAFFAGRFEVLKCHPEFISGSPARRQVCLQQNGMLKQVQHDEKKTIQLVLDGAHNPTKMRAFIQTVKKLYPKNPKVFVIAFKSDKNIKGMLKQILRLADEIIVTEFSGKTDTSIHASAPAESIKYEVSSMKYKSVSIEKDSKKALDKALHILISQYPNINAIIVVTGSLYLVGEVRSFLL